MAMTLDDKPWFWGLGIGVVLLVALVYGTQYFLINDIDTQIKDAEGQIAELDKKIEQGRAAERKLPQFREEVRRLELELEKLRRILPSTRNTEEIVKKLKALVDQGDFVLRSLNFPDLGKGGTEPYVEWPISVNVDGRYHNLAILFNRLSNFSRIINVEQINISALGTQIDRTINATFVAKTFVYVEQADEPAAGDKTAPAGATK